MKKETKKETTPAVADKPKRKAKSKAPAERYAPIRYPDGKTVEQQLYGTHTPEVKAEIAARRTEFDTGKDEFMSMMHKYASEHPEIVVHMEAGSKLQARPKPEGKNVN